MKSLVFFLPPPTPQLNLEVSCKKDVKILSDFVFSIKSYGILTKKT